MNTAPTQSLPFRWGQRLEWLAHGTVQEGHLTTWRGPNEAGVYVLTACVGRRWGDGGVLVTLHTPDPKAPAAHIREVARYA